jgi:hypothetical protein
MNTYAFLIQIHQIPIINPKTATGIRPTISATTLSKVGFYEMA